MKFDWPSEFAKATAKIISGLHGNYYYVTPEHYSKDYINKAGICGKK